MATAATPLAIMKEGTFDALTSTYTVTDLFLGKVGGSRRETSAREKGEQPRPVVCDEISDPHNLGAILQVLLVQGLCNLLTLAIRVTERKALQ